MSQTNFTPISIYYSTTASAVPTAANLVPGELAINTNDGKLYYEDSAGVVQVLATKSTGSIGGSNTQVQFNNSGSLGGSSGLTWDGSFLTTSSIKNSALTSGRVTYAGASGLLSDSANLQFNGTNLGVGATPSAWNAVFRVLNLHDSFNIYGQTNDPASGGLVANSYFGTSSFLYKSNGFATHYTQTDGIHKWLTAPSGTAGNAVTFTEAMRITNAGNVGIGTSSPGAKLQVNGSGGGQLFIDNAGTGDNYYDAGNHYFRASSGSSTKMVLDVNGQLGIGTNSPAALLNVSGALGSSAYSEIARFTNTSVNSGPKLTFYGVQGVQTPALLSGSIGFNQTFNQNNNGQPAFIIETGNSGTISEKLRVTHTGVLDIGTGAGAVGQIQFPATAVPSANANTLDDYEEGTWSPRVADASSGGNSNTSNSAGWYTKIGNQVTIYGSFDPIVTTGFTATNQLYIRDLPFQSANALGVGSGTTNVDNITFAGGTPTPYLTVNSTFFRLRSNVSGPAGAQLLVSSITSGSSWIYFVITYQV